MGRLRADLSSGVPISPSYLADLLIPLIHGPYVSRLIPRGFEPYCMQTSHTHGEPISSFYC